MEGIHSHQTRFILFLILAMAAVTLVYSQGTRVGYYSSTCPNAETIVRSTVRSHFKSDPTVAAGLLRLHFHDCFVQGCDASILIDGANSEKFAIANGNLKGFEVIDDAKSQLEVACPGVVSCADILALAARDSVVAATGPSWSVPTGRRDGRVSLASNAANLPGFTDSVDVQKQKFADKGLSAQDLITLLGAHTIGTAACQFFRYRMYGFNTTSTTDPAIDASFLPQLRALCPENGDGTKRVGLDTGSSNDFDRSYYQNLRDGKGILESDQMLWTDTSTKPFINRFFGIRGLLGLTFNAEFGRSMVKLSNVGVKTGTDGEIRKVCSAIN